MTKEKKTKKPKEEVVRYKENPFLDALQVTTKGKRITVTTGNEARDVIVNEATGEIKGTVITTYRQVDDEQFIKLFTQNIALTFGLKSAGIKAFNVLAFSVQKGIKTDIIPLDKYTLDDFVRYHLELDPPVELKLSEATFMRGLKELEKAQIIAKCMRRGSYFINPAFVFNGDRIAFNTVIERNKKDKIKANTAKDSQLSHDVTSEK